LEADIAGAEPAEPILLPPDLNMDTSLANQSLLAARSIGDLVAWSGGLYEPPAKFRNW
jgi:malonate decarboxylase alpha subunit